MALQAGATVGASATQTSQDVQVKDCFGLSGIVKFCWDINPVEGYAEIYGQILGIKVARARWAWNDQQACQQAMFRPALLTYISPLITAILPWARIYITACVSWQGQYIELTEFKGCSAKLVNWRFQEVCAPLIQTPYRIPWKPGVARIPPKLFLPL